MATMGQTIKKLRKERNLTQEELAEQLNITYQAVSKWENETGMPDISQVVPLASVFGVSTDVLFGTFGASERDEVRGILENAYRLNEGETADVKARYAELQDGLRKYPNNLWLLVNCLEAGHALTYLENALYDEAHREEIYRECERMASIIAIHSKETGDVLRAHMIMVFLHSAHGNIEKARDIASRFPQRSDMTFHLMSAFVAHYEKDYASEAEHSRENLKYHLESLAYAMMQLASAYKFMQRNDYAAEVYDRMKLLLDLFPNDEHFSSPTVWTEWGILDELIAELRS